MLRVLAASRNRRVVTTMDCLMLQHVLWHSPEEYLPLKDWLWQRAIPPSGLEGLEYIVGNLIDRAVRTCFTLEDDLATSSVPTKGSSTTLPSELTPLQSSSLHNTLTNDPLKSFITEIDTYITILTSKVMDFELLRKECLGHDKVGKNIWLSPSELAASKQQLAPRADKSFRGLSRLLKTVIAMKFAMSTSSVINEYDDTEMSVVDKTDLKKSPTLFIEEVSYKEKAEMLNKIWGGYSKSDHINNSSDDMSEDTSDTLMSTFSSSVLALSKKEAQKILSADDFKVWKKAQKATRKKSSKGDRDIDDDE